MDFTKGKRTWFCKDTQKWVSEIPRAFWIGNDKFGNKVYSDLKKNEDSGPVQNAILSYQFPITDGRRFLEKYGSYPSYSNHS